MSVLSDKFLAIEKDLNGILFERQAAIRGMLLATLSKTNILLLGSAGIAKSALIEQWNRRITESKYFAWLLTKFTPPEELFGPPSLKGLEEERYTRVTRGKLPEANTVFLDETFKANSSILNSLLTVMNERIFYNDSVPMPLDIVTIAGASNEIPESDDGLDAFFDRFLLKFHLKPIQENSNFTKMLRSAGMKNAPANTITLAEIRQAQAEIANITIPDVVFSSLVKLRDELRKEGISVTDRTFKISMDILKAQAFLAGRTEVAADDIEIYKNICWNKPEQEKTVHSIILKLISPEKNKILTKYEECQEVAKTVYKQKDANKKQQAMIEANKKIKDAKVEIEKLKRDMSAKKQDTTEVEKMETELEKMMIAMASEVLGINVASLQKD